MRQSSWKSIFHISSIEKVKINLQEIRNSQKRKMVNNLSSIDYTGLDFDTAKADLIKFLKSQDQFKDYDFTGSNMNVLIDILAYNYNKTAFLYNMNISESFIDSAQLRDSLCSISKPLNYLPRSTKSAKAIINVKFTATGEHQPYIIQKGQSFSTIVKNDSYIFSIPETLIVSSVDNNFEFETEIYEGTYVKDSYIYQPDEEVQFFRLKNKNVDIDSITVTVTEDNKLIGDKYFLQRSLLDLNYNSKVYFMQSSEGFYEILFGDNVLGRKPKDNAVITIDYRLAKGDAPNGAQKFTANFEPTGQFGELTSNPIITTISAALGGDQPESNESIRYYAPRHFQRQERTVIPQDYEDALKEEFPEVNAVSAIGGEDMNPPQFGFIFIAVDIKNVDGFPDAKKKEYYDFIRKRSSLSPVFIEPQFTYFAIKSKVRYNVNLTTAKQNTIKTLVINQIANYNLNELNDFGVILRYSPFCNIIDEADASIISDVTEVKLYKKLTPSLATPTDFVLNFGVALKNDSPIEALKYTTQDSHTITSDVFRYQGISCVLADDNAGTIRLVQLADQSFTTLFNVGSVNYATGEVILNKLRVDLYDGDALKLYATTADKDIVIPKDTIGQIELNQIDVTIEALQE